MGFVTASRLACVHCRLYPGGGLQVFADLIDRSSFDQAVVFTLISPYTSFHTTHHRIRVVTALPRRVCQIFHYCERHRIPLLSWLFDYRNLMPFYPVLMWILSYKIKHYKPDTCLISSFAIAKNISIPDGVRSILYIHSPMQYIWDNYDEYMNKLTGCKKWMFWLVSGYLRRWDIRHRLYDQVYVNSHYTAGLVQKYYKLQSDVLYPAVHPLFVSYAESIISHGGDVSPISKKSDPYYVCVGRLVAFVRECDRIVRLCNRKGFQLYMIGSGPDEDLLKSLAGNTIHFVGHISDVDKKRQLIAGSSGLINLAKESFGLNTVEGLMCGVPVFVYGGGGSLEIVGGTSLISSGEGQYVSTDIGVMVGSKDDTTLDVARDTFVTQSYDCVTIAQHALDLYV